jgi:hypothetical protein
MPSITQVLKSLNTALHSKSAFTRRRMLLCFTGDTDLGLRVLAIEFVFYLK